MTARRIRRKGAASGAPTLIVCPHITPPRSCGDVSGTTVPQAALRQAQGDNPPLQSSPVSFRLRGPSAAMARWPVVSFSRGSRGFTLLEILVAVTLLAVVFTSLFRLFGVSLRSIENSQKHARAAVLGEQLLTELLFNAPSFPIEQRDGRFEDNPDYSYRLDAVLFERAIGRIDESVLEERLPVTTYEINLTVKWDEGARKKSLKLTTLKTVLEGAGP